MSANINRREEAVIRSSSLWKALKHQELIAWQPIVSPATTFVVFSTFGLIFLAIGIAYVKIANKRFELAFKYDDWSTRDSDCFITERNQGFNEILSGSNQRSCEVVFTIPEDLPIVDDLYLYIGLDNFFQNHRRYILSKSDAQLRNGISFNSNFDRLAGSMDTDCTPENSLFATYENSDAQRLYYPCGLIALSFFNDGFQVKHFSRSAQSTDDTEYNLTWINGVLYNAWSTNEDEVQIGLSSTGIAWPSDLQNNYRNPTWGNNFPKFDYYEYLWQTYSQFSCYEADDPFERKDCMSWSEYARQIQKDLPSDAYVYGEGCAQCLDTVNHIHVNEGGILPPSDFSNPQSSEGIRDEKFIVWMRSAALPNFRKLIGKVSIAFSSRLDNSNSTNVSSETSTPRLLFSRLSSTLRFLESDLDIGFQKGDNITFRIIPNFPIGEFHGSKTLILSTFSPLLSDSKVLGLAYLSTGSIFLGIAFFVFLKMQFGPRRFGDIEHLKKKAR